MKGIIGAIVGSSIGLSYEIKKTNDYNFNIIYDKSNPSDDAIAIIATADWLMTTNRTKDEYIDKLHYWCNRFNYGMWNYGLATKFKEWVRNKDREPYNSFGNGSAMRVIPVGWAANSLQEAQELARITAEVTHNHKEGIKGAVAIASAIYLLREDNNVERAINYVVKNFGYKVHGEYRNLKYNHKFECTCQNSIPASLICFREAVSYEDGIRRAVSLGGDADTEAAITGALLNCCDKTEIDDELAKDVTRFFSMDILDVLKKFHEKYEM